jgi:hypothetical protein
MEDLDYRTAIVRICSRGDAYVVIKYHNIANRSKVFLVCNDGGFLDVDGPYDFGESLKNDVDIIQTMSWIALVESNDSRTTQ